MPTLIVDTEQAALIQVSVEMLQAALRARSARANPEKIITDSLALQANKLEVVMAQLSAPEPPEFSLLDASTKNAILGTIALLHDAPKGADLDNLWRQLRRLAITPGLSIPAPAR